MYIYFYLYIQRFSEGKMVLDGFIEIKTTLAQMRRV